MCFGEGDKWTRTQAAKGSHHPGVTVTPIATQTTEEEEGQPPDRKQPEHFRALVSKGEANRRVALAC